MANRNRTIRYAVKYEEFSITDAEFSVIAIMYKSEMKVAAIKFMRQQYGLGLKEAKDICDGVALTDATITANFSTVSPY